MCLVPRSKAKIEKGNDLKALIFTALLIMVALLVAPTEKNQQSEAKATSILEAPVLDQTARHACYDGCGHVRPDVQDATAYTNEKQAPGKPNRIAWEVDSPGTLLSANVIAAPASTHEQHLASDKTKRTAWEVGLRVSTPLLLSQATRHANRT